MCATTIDMNSNIFSIWMLANSMYKFMYCAIDERILCVMNMNVRQFSIRWNNGNHMMKNSSNKRMRAVDIELMSRICIFVLIDSRKPCRNVIDFILFDVI